MSETLDQIYLNNPSTTILDTDLFYLVHSPYSSGTDSAITGANLKSSISSPLSLTGDSGTIIGSALTLYANKAILNCGSTVSFVNSGTTSTLNVTDNDTALNTIIGLNSGTLALSSGGVLNTVLGSGSLPIATTGDSNTIIGASSMLLANNSSQNVSVGSENLLSLTTGNNNTVIGTLAGGGLVTGLQNIYIGYNSGNNNNSSESYNIYLAHPGVASESNVLRIGGGTGSSAGQINKAYISGIANNTGIGSYIVTIDSSTDQLGAMLFSPTSIETITGDSGTTNPSNNITIFANLATLTCGSSVSFINSGTTSTLNLTDANSNTILGNGAGNLSITGIDNVGIGTGVFAALLNGTGNVGIGINALLSTVGDSNLVAIGNSALSSINGGVNLVAVGTDALRVSVSDQDNTSIGFASLSSLNGGSSNTVLGSNAGLGLQTGSYNLILGALAGGTYSGAETSNIVLNSTGVLNETNALHIGSGTGSGPQQLLTAYISGINGNSLSGTPLMVTIDSSSDQLGVLAIPMAGAFVLDGDSGSATGNPLTLTALNGGNYCGSSFKFTASGTTVLMNVTDGNSNTMIGNGAGNSSLTGNSNTAFGFQAMNVATNASGNNAFGLQTLVALIDGNNNTGMGEGALARVTHGNANIGFGLSAGNGFTTGSYNLCFGYQSGVFNSGSDSNNIYIGHNGVSGDNNIMRIGNGTGTGQQQITNTYISGINGNSLSGTPLMVVINSTGGNVDQLGVQAIPTNRLPFTDEATSFTASSNNGYFITAAATVTLPPSPSQGDQINIYVSTSATVVVQANTGQGIQSGLNGSFSGGTATNTADGDFLILVYRAASSTWSNFGSSSWNLN